MLQKVEHSLSTSRHSSFSFLETAWKLHSQEMVQMAEIWVKGDSYEWMWSPTTQTLNEQPQTYSPMNKRSICAADKDRLQNAQSKTSTNKKRHRQKPRHSGEFPSSEPIITCKALFTCPQRSNYYASQWRQAVIGYNRIGFPPIIALKAAE